MNILVNATAAAAGAAGETYFTDIIPALLRSDPGKRYTVVLTGQQQPLASRFPPSVARIVLALPRNRIARGLKVQRALRSLVRSTRADILFNTGNFFTPRAGCRQICLVENANVFSRPEIRWTMTGRLRNLVLRRLTRLALANADCVIFPSHDIHRVMSRLTPIRAQVAIIPHGYASPGIDAAVTGLPLRFILCVSSLYPHKNLAQLVRAFSRLKEMRYEGTLVIVGYAGPARYRHDLEAVIRQHKVQGTVRVIPPVTRSTLVRYYRAADLAVLPSIEESFGLPAIEAMAEGCPVAAADAALSLKRGPFFNPFREICGEAAEYFDPFSSTAIADALQRALSPARRTELIVRGRERSSLYTWDKSAIKLNTVFDALAASEMD